MKEKFPGYFKPSDEEIKTLWGNALFTFDANILLNLYRYSKDTRNEFFKILESVDKVWIPFQSASEYLDNRLDVISQQGKAYELMTISLGDIIQKFQNSRQHPFISEKLFSQFSEIIEEICIELENGKKEFNDQINNDLILDKLKHVFEKKVGDEYSSTDLKTIIIEGEERYKNKIPPGFKDSDKKDKESNSASIRQFGDLIVWKQIILKANSVKSDVILVTDDLKEDWWIRFNGKTIGPRPELIKEFQIETGQSFYMYQSDRFLEFARDYLKQDVKQNAIDEIRELRNLDEKYNQENRNSKEELRFLEFKIMFHKTRLDLEDELSQLENEISATYSQIGVYQNLNNMPGRAEELDITPLQYRIENMEKNKTIVRQKIENIAQNEYLLERSYLRKEKGGKTQ